MTAAIFVLGSLTWSIGNALTAANQQSEAVKAVEWVRGHGGSQILRMAEDVWYTWHQPPKGGAPPKGAILSSAPTTSTTHTTAAGPAHLATPKNVVPFVKNPLPGEGVW